MALDNDFFKADQLDFFASLFDQQAEQTSALAELSADAQTTLLLHSNALKDAQNVLNQAQDNAMPGDYSVFMDTGCYQLFVQMVALAAHDLLSDGSEREEAIAWIYGTSSSAFPLKLLCQLVNMPEHVQDSLHAALLDHPREIIAASKALNLSWSSSGAVDPSAFQRYFTGDSPSWYAEDRLAEMGSDWAMAA